MVRSMNLNLQFVALVAVGVVLIGAHAKPPSRVVGGEDGEIGEFPYQVSVKKFDRHVCGGTIIGKRHILTAGHCIDGVSTNPAKEMTVTTGANALVPGAGVSNAIKTVTLHPNFVNNIEDSWKNDIAVIALTKDIVFDVFTKPAKLPEEDTPADLDCIASGWGLMSFPQGLLPNNVRKVEMRTIGNSECNQRHLKNEILDSHLCAYASVGAGLCVGDSGGPLVHDGELVGVVSWTIPCALGIPDVFTRVYFYLDFIKEAIATT